MAMKDDYDDNEYDYNDGDTPNDNTADQGKKRGGHGIFWFILIVGAIWFFFFRTDYSKPWIKENEEEDSFVIWCKDGNCNNTEHRYNLVVLNEGKAAYQDDRYILNLYMPNGGEVEISAFCAKASDGLIYDRYCQGYDESGELWLVAHLKY